MSDAAPTAPPAPHPEAHPAEGIEARCPNCGALRTGDYCAACGQKNAPLRQPVYVFLQDAATEYFGLDGRVWRSLGLLLFHPGRLTREYLAGRRARYLRPVRLYLTATLLFFFLLSVLDPAGRVESAIVGGDEGAADSTALVSERLAAVDAALVESADEPAAQETAADSLQARMDSLRQALGADSTTVNGAAAFAERMGALDEATAGRRSDARRRRLRRLEWQRGVLAGWPTDSLIHPADLDRASVLLFGEGSAAEVHIGLPEWVPQSEAVQRLRTARTESEKGEAATALLRDTIARMPTVMFLLLPVFALLLKVIYVRRGWFYSEHLVFALHTHAFAFLAFAVMALLLGFSGGAGWALTASQGLAVLIPVYFYVAQKRVYGQGWVKTGLKALILGWVYFWLLVLVGLTLAFVLAAVLG